MEPAFKKMAWPEATAPANFWRRQRPAIAAMRVLWLRTLGLMRASAATATMTTAATAETAATQTTTPQTSTTATGTAAATVAEDLETPMGYAEDIDGRRGAG
ncbi:unnamed protein product [Prorocentrum cordatum]|uniref:Uncharacterized protein n=1 Tax=Prorocentrum cordatum TaxID=2364126 RepID=A0ABN9T473_9DINO|nr:unnamed protein product [Polarella glacialis]